MVAFANAALNFSLHLLAGPAAATTAPRTFRGVAGWAGT
jgi:hypothetical protein